MATNSKQPSRRIGAALGILLGLIGISLAGLLIPTSSRIWIWIGAFILLALFVVVLGFGITGRWLGLLIDDRRKMSLSRFQTVLWIVLILSALLAAALTNLPLINNPIDALTIGIPPELLGILGISMTSLAGAQLILNNKKPEQVDKNGDGTDPSDRPGWFDMFKGDDVANADYLDLSKVQMFYFTIILALVYGAALGVMFMTVDPRHPSISAFPALNATIVGLLGISHAGYLTYKAVPRVLPSEDQPSSDLPSIASQAGAAPPVPSSRSLSGAASPVSRPSRRASQPHI